MSQTKPQKTKRLAPHGGWALMFESLSPLPTQTVLSQKATLLRLPCGANNPSIDTVHPRPSRPN